MTSARPTNLVVVAGTATEVGKTWVATRLVDAWRRTGWTVSARKPGQSFHPATPDAATDRGLLAAATTEAPDDVCPERWCYPCEMAPPMAARALGRPEADRAALLSWLHSSWPVRRGDVGLIETAGSVGSPLARDLDTAGLVSADADLVVLVADAGLGTIGSVRANLALLGTPPDEVPPVVVHLNRFESHNPLHRANVEWLTADAPTGVDIVTGVDELARACADRFVRFDPYTGRRGPSTDDPPPLEPARYCDLCGRKLKVVIVPTAHRARCTVHGEIAQPPTAGC